MKPIEFPQQTAVLAKNQPEYLPLPVFADGQQMISCWGLSWVERLTLLFTGKLWLRQMTFGERLQPQLPQVEPPFAKPPEEPAPVMPSGRSPRRGTYMVRAK